MLTADATGHKQTGGRSSQIIYLETQEPQVCPAVQGDQGAPTVPSGQAALGTLYLLWDLACPGLEIQESPSLLSLREGLRGVKSESS